MAKRKQQRDAKAEQTLTYKQIARERVEKKHRQRMLIVSAAIAAVITIILLVAIINELVIKPGQPVASVNDTVIKTEQFQERVRLERGQTIERILQYAEIFGVEQVYSIAAQLDQYEVVGEQVLDAMIDEALIRQGAAELAVSVSDGEVSRYLEEQIGYYRGGTPTPPPTLTPVPSPTPITDTVATPAPTRTPLPTPTLVTEEAFKEFYQQQLDLFKQLGVGEETYLGVLYIQLLVEKVREQLMQDQPAEADQVEAEALVFTNEDDLDSYLERLQSGEPFEELVAQARENSEDAINARSITWTPREELGEQYGLEAAEKVFLLTVGEQSDVIVSPDGEFLIFYVTGREVRPLGASTLGAREDRMLTEWLVGLREAAEIEKHDSWRSRVPREPSLDPRLLVPTPTLESEG
jgi:parvulin-like peptidyl-prolyl isomerase